MFVSYCHPGAKALIATKRKAFRSTFTHYNLTQLFVQFWVFVVLCRSPICALSLSVLLFQMGGPGKCQYDTPTCMHRFVHKDQIADLR